MEKRLAIMIGLQGSGKSTFYQKMLSGEYLRVNLDTLKTRHRERLLIEDCLARGCAFAVDNTNPTREDRARYISAAKPLGYRVIGYYMKTDLKDCMARNAMREGKARVPDVAIAATAKKLEPPAFDEGFDELYAVSNDGVTMTVTPWEDKT